MMKLGLLLIISILIGVSSFADTCKKDLNNLKQNDYAVFFEKFSKELRQKANIYGLSANDLENATIVSGKSISKPRAGSVFLLSTPSKQITFFEYRKLPFMQRVITSDFLYSGKVLVGDAKKSSLVRIYKHFGNAIEFSDGSLLNVDLTIKPNSQSDELTFFFSNSQLGQAIQKLKEKGQKSENSDE